MFQVTAEALAHAAYELGQTVGAENVVIRLSAHESGLVIRSGRIEPDDLIFDHDGRPVIAVSKELAEELGNVVLQAEETDEGTRLQLRELG